MLHIIIATKVLVIAKNNEEYFSPAIRLQFAGFELQFVKDIHPDNETQRKEWIYSNNVMPARADWNLISGRVVRNPEEPDLPSPF